MRHARDETDPYVRTEDVFKMGAFLLSHRTNLCQTIPAGRPGLVRQAVDLASMAATIRAAPVAPATTSTVAPACLTWSTIRQRRTTSQTAPHVSQAKALLPVMSARERAYSGLRGVYCLRSTRCAHAALYRVVIDMCCLTDT
jgi:hypothetical protein